MQSPGSVRIALVICRVGDGMRRIKLKGMQCKGDITKVESEEWVRGEALRSLRVRGRSSVALFKGRAVRRVGR